jgi:hypothetical protein
MALTHTPVSSKAEARAASADALATTRKHEACPIYACHSPAVGVLALLKKSSLEARSDEAGPGYRSWPLLEKRGARFTRVHPGQAGPAQFK